VVKIWRGRGKKAVPGSGRCSFGGVRPFLGVLREWDREKRGRLKGKADVLGGEEGGGRPRLRHLKPRVAKWVAKGENREVIGTLTGGKNSYLLRTAANKKEDDGYC